MFIIVIMVIIVFIVDYDFFIKGGRLKKSDLFRFYNVLYQK